MPRGIYYLCVFIITVYGSALASFTVEKFGTERISNLSSKEVFERLQMFKNLTQFDIELT